MNAYLSSIKELDARIEELEQLQKKQSTEIKESAGGLLENLSPGKAVRSMLGDVVFSPQAQQYLFDLMMSVGAGIAGKKLYTKNKTSLFSRITGTALQSVITRFISKKLHHLRERKHQTADET